MSSKLATDVPEAPAASGRGVVATWRYTVSSIIFITGVMYLVILSVIADTADERLWRLVAAMALLVLSAAAAIRYFWFFRRGLGSGLPDRKYTWWLFAPAVAFAAICLLPPSYSISGYIPLWIAVNCLVTLLPTRKRLPILAAGALAGVLYAVAGLWLSVDSLAEGIFPDSGIALVVFYGILMPAMILGGIWWWDIVIQLERSRRASGELAVAKERLRFASDLHDIQGHHLQVIALKTELAARLLDKDTEAARTQILEAQELARTALEDTRALVRGYRQVSLKTEAANAGEVLEAAGIQARMEVPDMALEAEQATLFGLVVREATTNILRHSEARAVSFELARTATAIRLTVKNDGASAASVESDGTGIVGLRERFGRAGGSVETENDGADFVLTASLPLRSE